MLKNKEILIILLTILAVSLPFINRAYFVDDYYHVTMAKGIIEHPFRPYDFKSDDTRENISSWESGSFPRMVNPPLMHYYLAAVIRLFGDEEYKIRLGFLIFPFIAALAGFLLLKRFTKYALEAVLLFIFSQAFWLSAYSLMIDMAAIAVFLLGFEFFIRGCEKDRNSLLCAAGVLLGLAPMAKYTMYAGYLFVLVWLWMADYKWKRKIKYSSIFLIPVFIALLWAFWNIQVYGRPHFIASLERSNAGNLTAKIFTGLIFASGTSIYSLFFWAAVFKESRKIFAALAAVFFILFFYASSPLGGFNYIQSLLISVFTASSFAIFYVLLRNFRDFNKFLLIWFFAGLAFILMPIPWVAGRYFLFVGLPLAVLSVDAAEKYFLSRSKFVINGMICASIIIGLLTGIGDYMQAEVYRKIKADTSAETMVSAHKGKKIVFGDAFFGFSHYLKKDGWEVIYDSSNINSGDFLLVSTQSIPISARPPLDVKLKILKIFKYDTIFPVRVMDLASSAGFYATAGGALPFSISGRPMDVFVLYEIL